MNVKMILAAMVLAGARLAIASEAPHHSDEHKAPAHESAAHAQHDLPYTHPTVPGRADWAGATVIGILGSFLLAAAVGVGVRLNTPEEAPAAHSHDDGHGHHSSDHGHHH